MTWPRPGRRGRSSASRPCREHGAAPPPRGRDSSAAGSARERDAPRCAGRASSCRSGARPRSPYPRQSTSPSPHGPAAAGAGRGVDAGRGACVARGACAPGGRGGPCATCGPCAPCGRDAGVPTPWVPWRAPRPSPRRAAAPHVERTCSTSETPRWLRPGAGGRDRDPAVGGEPAAPQSVKLGAFPPSSRPSAGWSYCGGSPGEGLDGGASRGARRRAGRERSFTGLQGGGAARMSRR